MGTPQHRAPGGPPVRRNKWLSVAATATLIATSLGGAAFAATLDGESSPGDGSGVATTSLLSEDTQDAQMSGDEVDNEGAEGGSSTSEEEPLVSEEEPLVSEEEAAVSEPEQETSAVSGEMGRSTRRSAMTSRALSLQPTLSVYTEDFENSTGTTPKALASGVGGTRYQAADGMYYTAETYWGYPNRCNGIILSYNSVKSSPLTADTADGYGACDGPTNSWSWASLRAQAQLLGQLNGKGDNNRALAELSSGWINSNVAGLYDDGWIGQYEDKTGQNRPTVSFTPMVQFKTEGTRPINTIPFGGQDYRFLAAQTNVATISCPTTGKNFVSPLLAFSLTDAQGREYPLFDTGAGSYLDTCKDPRLSSTTMSRPSTPNPNASLSATYGTLTTDKAIPWFGPQAGSLPQVGVILRNAQWYTGGNDSSLDDIAIIDVTPVLFKKFADKRVEYNKTTGMTITVQSRADMSHKEGWQFTDTLPAGMELASNVTLTAYDKDEKVVSGGCTANIAGSAGSKSIAVTNGNMKKNVAECRFTTTVTVKTNETCPAEKTFVNKKDEFGDSLKYVDFQEGDEVTFYGTGKLSWTKTDSVTGQPVPGANFTLTKAGTTVPFVDGGGGTFTANDLAYGDYTITETKAPEGYEEASWSQNVAIKAGDANSCVKEFTVTNVPKPKLTLIKVVDNPTGATTSAGYLETKDWTLKAVGEGTNPGLEGKTGVSGLVTSGKYSLNENSSEAAAGSYTLSSLKCESNAGAKAEFTEVNFPATDGVVTPGDITLAPGNDVTCTFTNTPKPGSVTWRKVDDSTPAKQLAGSEWLLTGPGLPTDGLKVSEGECKPTNLAADCTYIEVGGFEVENLAWGVYTLKETKAPPGYAISDTWKNGKPFTIKPTAPGLTIDLGLIENEQQEGPTQPLTGGQSAALFTAIGLLTLGGAGGAALLVRRRRVS